MKAALIVLFLTVCTAERHIDILAALHKGEAQEEKPKFDILAILHGKVKKPSGPDPTAFLGKIMQGTQRGLALAEKHHDKAVKIARDKIDSLLTKESRVVAKAMQTYNSSLQSAIASLEEVKDSAKATLDKAEKASSSSSWESSAGEDQAQLSAKVSMVESELRKAARKAKSGVREASSRAELMITDGDVQKLSRKVGDITDLTDKTNVILVPAEGSVQESKPAFTQKSGAATSLKGAQSSIMAALQQVDASRTSAEKILNAVFDGVEKELAAGTKDIDAGMVAAEKEELEKVHRATANLDVPKKGAHAKKPII